MDAYIVPMLYEYAFSGDSMLNEPSIFIIDNPGWTNTKTILEKFPKAKIDAVNYSFGENSKQYWPGNKNVKMYKYMSFDLLKKWEEKGKNKKYNLVYLDTEQVVNKTVNSLIYLKNMLSREFNRIITVYSIRGKVGSITAIDGNSYTHHTVQTFFNKNGYKDLGRSDPYTSGYGKDKVSKSIMRLRVLVYHGGDDDDTIAEESEKEKEPKKETVRKRKRIVYDEEEEDYTEKLEKDKEEILIKNLPYKKRILKRIEENDLQFKTKNVYRGNTPKDIDFVELKNPADIIIKNIKLPQGMHPLVEAKIYGKIILRVL